MTRYKNANESGRGFDSARSRFVFEGILFSPDSRPTI